MNIVKEYDLLNLLIYVHCWMGTHKQLSSCYVYIWKTYVVLPKKRAMIWCDFYD